MSDEQKPVPLDSEEQRTDAKLRKLKEGKEEGVEEKSREEQKEELVQHVVRVRVKGKESETEVNDSEFDAKLHEYLGPGPDRADELDHMSHAELRMIARRYGIALGWSKDELERRILAREMGPPPHLVSEPPGQVATIRVKSKKTGDTVTINADAYDEEFFEQAEGEAPVPTKESAKGKGKSKETAKEAKGTTKARAAELDEMSADELREVATKAGLSHSGTKEELKDRILAHEKE